MHRECNIKVHEDEDLITIEIMGCITSSAQGAMEEAYRKACGCNTRDILLRFDGKSRISSAVISIVINLVTVSQEKGCRVFVTGLSGHSRKMFELLGLTRYTTIIESEAEIRKS